jgi:hypothetical protein
METDKGFIIPGGELTFELIACSTNCLSLIANLLLLALNGGGIDKNGIFYPFCIISIINCGTCISCALDLLPRNKYSIECNSVIFSAFNSSLRLANHGNRLVFIIGCIKKVIELQRAIIRELLGV